MIKKVLAIILCGMMLLCFVACGENLANTGDTLTDTNQSETDPALENETLDGPTTQSTNAEETAPVTEQITPVFETKNITRITFYGYYGSGKGSDVSSEHMAEITNWLASFTTGEKAPELMPPGTNTIYVEIAYADETVLKKGLDTVTVDGVAYYTKHDKAPECYSEILSHISLS